MAIQIIEENRKPSTAQKFNKAFGALLQGGQQIMDQQAKAQALKTAGLPEGYNLLPEQAQSALAKKTFAGPEKPLNALQISQMEKNNQITNYYKENERLAKELGMGSQEGGNSFSNQIMQEPQEQRPQDFDLATGEYQPKKQPKVNKEADLKKKKEQLTNIAGFKGEKGPRGVKANIAQAELDRMEKEEKEAKENKRFQSKEVTESFKENKDYINNTYDKYEDSLRRDAIFDRMEQLESSGELSDSGTINFLESLGLKPEWLKNPNNEEYTKLALDLLGGGSLQADYGSRVLQSEFKVSQQRIPTLSQTPEGRRQIIENHKAMMLPSKLKNERLQYYLDKSERTGEPLPHNLRGKILKDIQPQLEEAYDKFKQRNGRYKVREGTTPDENAQEKYFFLADENIDKALKYMKEDGYDIQ